MLRLVLPQLRHIDSNTSGKNEVFYAMRATKIDPSFQTLDKLKRLQWEVEEVIAMAKTRWLCHFV